MNKEPVISGRMMFYGESALHATFLRITLKDDPDLFLLQKAVDEAVRHYPWVTYGVREERGMFYFRDDLPRSIRIAEWNEDNPPVLGGKDAEGHLFGVFHHGRNLYLSIFHGLTDASGVEAFVDCALGCYRSLLKEKPFIFMEPEYPDMEAEPFLRINNAMREAGVVWGFRGFVAMLKKAVMVWRKNYATHTASLSSEDAPRSFFIRADAGELMEFIKGLGIKPSAAFVSLYAAAFLKVHPDAQDNIKVALPVDYRDVLGIPHTFRDCTMPPAMFKVKIKKGESFREMAARINRIVMQITDPKEKLYAVKEYAVYMNLIPKMSYDRMNAILAKSVSLDRLLFTFVCSYAHRFRDEPYLDLIEQMYVMNPPYGPVPVLEIVAMPDQFCISLTQNSSTDVYIRAFLEQLKLNGINAALVETIGAASQYVDLRQSIV